MTNTTNSARIERIEQLLNVDPNNSHLLREAAELSMDSGNFDLAGTYLARAEEGQPDDPQLLNLRGLLAMRTGSMEAARDAFQSLRAAGVDAPGIRYNLAYALMVLGTYEEVPALLHDALDIVEQIPDAGALKVRALHCLGEIDEAIALGRAYLEKRPDDAAVSGLLSTLYMDSEDFDAAAKYAELATRGDAKIPEGWVTLGMLELAGQRDKEATEHFDRALALKPTSGRARVGRGLAQVLDMRFAGATADLQEAARLMPDHIGTWHALGWTQLFNKDVAGAKASFEQALAMDRNFAESHGAMAVMAVVEGNLGEADAAVRRSLGLDKACFSGRFAQSLLLSAKGRPDIGEKIIEAILEHRTSMGTSLREVFVNFAKERQGPPRKQ
jgi:Flp pilus assembly protein TadD